MNQTSNQAEEPHSMEEGIHDFMCDTRNVIRHRYRLCEKQVHKSPATAVLGSFAAGYLLHRLPLRAILVTQVRVLAALAPPALFLFGAAKLCGFLKEREMARK